MTDEYLKRDLEYLVDGWRDMQAEILRLRAEKAALRAAGEGVVKWWLEGGSMRLEGAPYCMFALRRALDGERAAAALKERRNE